MSRTRTAVIALSVACVVGPMLAAQRDPVPSSAPGANTAPVQTRPSNGTASLSGRIVTDAAGRPVRRAIVKLTGSELPQSVSTISDDQGRFAFTGLPAGRVTVTASKAAHLTTAYGARQPGRPGTPVSVAAGQDVRDIVLQLPAGGVITGTVRNQYGEPMPGVAIVVGRPELDRPGAGQSSTLGNVATDDRGVFRVFGLEPGNYIVGAQMRLSQGAVLALAEREVTEALASLQRGAPAPGRSASTTAPRPVPPAPLSAMAPIFFPGTADVSQAQMVSVRAGEERSGIDIALQPVPALKISGTVSAPSGQLPPIQISFASDVAVQLPGYSASQPSLSRGTGNDGRFTYTGVIPGRYMITARTTGGGRASGPATAGAGGGGSAGGSGGQPGGAASETWWASATVTVTDADVEGLALALAPALRVTGRVEFDATTLTPPTSLGDMRLGLLPRRDGGYSTVNGALFGGFPIPPAMVAPDRTFTMTGILPGVYQFNPIWPGGKAWWVRSAMADGVDLLDRPLEVGPDGKVPTSLVVTYSDRQTELSGVLQTAGGAPAPEYFIIAFSTDSRTWRPQARRLASTRPATDGAFSIKSLPPGEYYLAALTDLDPAEWQTPAFLSQLAPVSLKFSLTDGQQLRKDLRVQ